MRKQCARIAIVALASATLLWAAGFWEQRGYTDWSEKDVKNMLHNSPWAKQVSISMGGPGGGGRGGRGIGGGGGGGAGGGGFGGGGGGARMRRGGQMSGGGARPSMKLVVRWSSSLPVKQAVMKLRFGPEAESAQEAQDILARVESHYVVTVSGFPARMARMAENPAWIQQSAFLIRKNKPALGAEHVQVNPTEKALNLHLLFPRTDPIMLEDKNVDLKLVLGRIEVKRKFKLKDMLFDGDLSL